MLSPTAESGTIDLLRAAILAASPREMSTPLGEKQRKKCR
jgi:hypothetical protein